MVVAEVRKDRRNPTQDAEQPPWRQEEHWDGPHCALVGMTREARVRSALTQAGPGGVWGGWCILSREKHSEAGWVVCPAYSQCLGHSRCLINPWTKHTKVD